MNFFTGSRQITNIGALFNVKVYNNVPLLIFNMAHVNYLYMCLRICGRLLIKCSAICMKTEKSLRSVSRPTALTLGNKNE